MEAGRGGRYPAQRPTAEIDATMDIAAAEKAAATREAYESGWAQFRVD
jgi:hypothetical protein